MKRSTLTLITAGMILAGTGAVELLGDASAGARTAVDHTPGTCAHGTEVHSP
ncbi:hypothetical protein [Nocardia terpenica]|uniref:hypothetical protein n=1 Tax=Nocardia terpenica TaxID=455432 RepID=UPI0012FE1797|nr:hypothetical protein [Nocardia terpenica]